MKVLFLYLTSFSKTGGIEKFNRAFLKALHELSIDDVIDADALSSHDKDPDEKYFHKTRFRAFNGNKLLFAFCSVKQAFKYDTFIIGHINLALVGYLIKKLKPTAKLILITHGIEVWMPQTRFKKKLLQSCDTILSVSNYTKDRILFYNPYIQADKIKIFPNTLDPYFPLPANFDKPGHLLERYNLGVDKQIILTVTRMAYTEKYKGYDNIIKVLKSIKSKIPSAYYLLGGKSESQEKNRIDVLMEKFGATDFLQLLGYISDKELTDHYLLADAFVMPSKKEGFGIVFIEALACGRNVVAGNKDGSADALMNGELGLLIDPDNEEELEEAIIKSLNRKTTNESMLEIQKKVIEQFGFNQYKNRLQQILLNDL